MSSLKRWNRAGQRGGAGPGSNPYAAMPSYGAFGAGCRSERMLLRTEARILAVGLLRFKVCPIGRSEEGVSATDTCSRNHLQSSSMAVSFQWFPLFSLFPENFHCQQLFRTSTRFQFLGKGMGLLCLSLGCGGIAQKDFHENGRVDAVDMLIACGPAFAGTAML